MLSQPLHGGEGLADQDLRQLRVGKPVGDPHHIVVILALGIAAHFDGVFLRCRHVRDQGLDVLDTAEGEADDTAGEVGVTTSKVFRCLLHHHH